MNMTRAPGGPSPKTACVAFLYRSQPVHFCTAASSLSRLVVSGTNGAAECAPSVLVDRAEPVRAGSGPLPPIRFFAMFKPRPGGTSSQPARVLERFANAERAEAIAPCRDIALHLPSVNPRVLSKRPSDRLADEEVVVVEARLDARVEQVDIGVGLESNLAEECGAALPQIPVARPAAHQPFHAGRLAAQHVAEMVGGEEVHVVPPGSGHDHLLVHRKRVERLARAVSRKVREANRRVALLAVSCIPP